MRGEERRGVGRDKMGQDSANGTKQDTAGQRKIGPRQGKQAGQASRNTRTDIDKQISTSRNR